MKRGNNDKSLDEISVGKGCRQRGFGLQEVVVRWSAQLLKEKESKLTRVSQILKLLSHDPLINTSRDRVAGDVAGRG